MPHIFIDYSANLENTVDIAQLCETLRLAAINTGYFATAGIRVRAFAANHCVIADGNPIHGYIDFSVRLREGRDQALKEDATQQLFSAADAFLAENFKSQSIALSMEMREISASLAPKTGTIRAHMGISK